MEGSSVFYFFAVYLLLVLVVVGAASRRRINLFKAFIISVLFTPVIGLVALFRASRKVIVTHYNPLNPCSGCPNLNEIVPETCEGCEFIEKLTDKLSIKRKYLI